MLGAVADKDKFGGGALRPQPLCQRQQLADVFLLRQAAHIQKHGLAGLYAPARAQRRGGGRVNTGKAGGVNAGGQRVHGAGDAVAFQQARDPWPWGR